MKRPATAHVTRLTPEGSTLTGSRGPLALGAVVQDGDEVTLATPDGSAGAVTLDARGVTLRIRSVRLEAAAVVVGAAGEPRVLAKIDREAARTFGIAEGSAPLPKAHPVIAVKTGDAQDPESGEVAGTSNSVSGKATP